MMLVLGGFVICPIHAPFESAGSIEKRERASETVDGCKEEEEEEE